MAAPVRISLRIPGTAPMPQLMTLIQDVEAAGFDGAGILDSQLLCRDTFATMALAATQTSRLTLFPAVTNPFTRHASVLAGAIQTVEELAPGRIKFVIGTGYTSASTIGRKPATLAQMRACIRTVKTLLAGNAVDFQGIPGRLGYAAGRDIPVLMAASGPKAIELAGEIADGVLLLVGFTPGSSTRCWRVWSRSTAQWPAPGRPGDCLGRAHRYGVYHRRSPASGAPHGSALGYSELGEPLAAARWPPDPGV